MFTDPMKSGSLPFPATETLRDKIAGSLYAGALGDALGYTVEFDRWSAIQGQYGAEGIREPKPTWGKARISDDTQMTMFTAEGMLLGGDGSDVTEDIYQAYLCWLCTQGYNGESRFSGKSLLLQTPDMNHRRAPGNTCLSALLSGSMGTIKAPLNHSKGCGGVMRTAPLGFVRLARNGESPFGSALENGAGAAAITHGHPAGWLPAGMLSDMVDRCIYGNYDSLRTLAEDALKATEERYGDFPETAAFASLMRRAMDLSEALQDRPRSVSEVDEPAIRSLGEGWVGDEALAIALYAALRYADDLPGGLIAAVNHNGDSDSTGAIAGNILGAWLGYAAIPGDWLEKLELREELEALVEGMVKRTQG